MKPNFSWVSPKLKAGKTKYGKGVFAKQELGKGEREQNQAFSEIDLVNECLVDEKRTRAFEAAIKKAVKPHRNVLDIGTGSGVLAMFAARAGAKKVTAIEFDKFIAKIVEENIKNNGLENKIEVITADATKFTFPKNKYFDIVIGEMLTTGIVDEFQVQAINNLHKQKAVSRKTVFIPNKQETYISLCRTNFKIYGFQMKMVRHLWENYRANQKAIMFSKPVILNKVDFSKQTNETFEGIISLKAERTGKINSTYLTSKTILSKNIILEDTKTLNAPVIVPVKEKNVSVGEIVKIKIKYGFGRGYENFCAEAV